jgi:hypothetical protein
VAKKQIFYFFTLGALVHLRHFKLDCSFAALCIYLSFGHGLNGNGWQRKAGKKTKLQIPESSFYPVYVKPL